METDKNWVKPQLVLTSLGIIMLVLSWFGFAASEPVNTSVPGFNQDSRLKVVPSRSVAPKSAIDQLQGASSLQGQNTQGLQQPVGEQLQPNAKTSNLNSTQTIQ